MSLVKVVAETLMCQPAPLAVTSATVNCWSADTLSTALWLLPLRVAAQLSELGDVNATLPTNATDPVVAESTGAKVLVTISDL
jgi:hypothetical protein